MSKRLLTASVAGSLLTGSFLTATLITSGPAAAAGPWPGSLACDHGICWLDPSGRDSDGDGYSDADELAAGTDPKDPTSRPKILQLLNGYLAGLQPEAPGFRELVVLPRFAPDGGAVESSALAFGPQRGDALTRLGITDGRLSGVDVSNGLRASIDLSRPKPPSGGPNVTVGRIDPLVAAGQITRTETTLGGVTMTEYEQDGKDVGWKVERPDGSMDLDIKAEGKRQYGTVSSPKELPGGGSERTGSSTSITTKEDGSEETLQVTSKETKDGVGNTVTEKSYYSETKDAKGNLTSQTHTQITTTQRADGSETVEKTVTKTDVKTGQTTTTTSTTQTTPEGKSTCTGDACPKKGYINTEIDPGLLPGDTVVMTPGLAARFAAVTGGNVNQGDTGVEPGSPDDVEPPQYSPRNRGVILIDPGNDAVWWTPMPTMPDPEKVGGNTTPVRNVTDPLSGCLPTAALPCPK